MNLPPTCKVWLACIALALLVACAQEPAASDMALEPEIAASELMDRMLADKAPYILDVRGPDEYVAGHLPGAVNIVHTEFLENPEAALMLLPAQPDTEIVIHCVSGKRSGMAAEVLAAAGYTNVRQLTGDFRSWQAGGYPVISSE
jgi:phage shock protein E